MPQYGEYHLYSYPYQLQHYDRITNNFPGGIFTKFLSINNTKEQNNKQFRKSKNEDQDLSIIKYLHLKELELMRTHIDYLGQFLLDIKTCLPNNVYLLTNYLYLKRVTRNFTRKTTRFYYLNNTG
ncbi:unnamed protein product [Rotaria sordida]|uniref:Uncharacterized protein n=1 Tax=Rotaria sordida TaxID=392033 RepID=A0A818Y2A3_9BILA|nr:unnamed protein product [Rotaria sordida]